MEQLITVEHLDEAAAAVETRCSIEEGALGIVLGSGLSSVFESIENTHFIDYADVPHMAVSTAPMHVGRFVIGTLGGRQVVCMQGRLHAYEGYSAQQIAFPILLMHRLGVTELVVTNAAGGINEAFNVGDLMLIEDHINLLGMNPCVGLDTPELFPRFFDMTHAYSSDMRERALIASRNCGVALQTGVYLATLGPSFETPAEIRAFRTLGADAVGMSTVLEVIAARACGMEVLGISMISNPAAGVLDEPLSMDDVAIAANAAAGRFAALLVAFVSH